MSTRYRPEFLTLLAPPGGANLAAALAILAAPAIFAQAPSPRPAFTGFEVATIKPTAVDWDGGRYMRMQTAHQFVARNYSLKALLAAAYNLAPQEISGGPAWTDSEHFDILAQAPNGVRPDVDQQMTMLRSLLRDRFKLTTHREPKVLSIYALTVARNGPKMMESTVSPDASPEGPPPLVFVLSPQGARLPGRNATMAALASLMQRGALDRPVVDQTGLSGRYDFDLEWRPDESQFGGQFRGPAETDPAGKPDLFEALQQQLGLRLEAARGPIEALLIDQVQRPSAN